MPAGALSGALVAQADVISKFLHQGENVLWIGRPGFSLAPSPTERTHLIGLVFVAVALMVAVSSVERLEGSIAVLGAVAGLLGLVALFQFYALWRSFTRRGAIVYCLTNERALIIEGSGAKSLAWLRIAYDTPVAVTALGGGRGHVAFGRRYDFDTEEWPIFRGFAFYDIRGVQRVADLIERMQDGMAPPGTVPGIKAMAAAERRPPDLAHLR
jgi:hypothetical protein